MTGFVPTEGCLGLRFLGQVGVAVQGPGGTIYMDPYLTDSDGGGGRLPRNFPPPLEPAQIRDADAVLISHAHIDHFDPATLRPLSKASPQAHFYGPHPCDFAGFGLEPSRFTHPEVLVPFEVAGARITPIPSAHTALERSEQGYPYLGYVLEWAGLTLYHAGDTVIWDAEGELERGLIETLRGWRLDAAFLPINGRDYFRDAQGLVGNMNLREAAGLTEALDIGTVFPTHYDLFPMNGENPAHFLEHLYRLNPRRRAHLLQPGETFVLCAR